MLRVVSDVLRRRRARGWLVGGSVRDRELGRPSPDIDLVVADDPGAVAKEVAAALKAPWFALSERHGAYRVVGREGHVDVAGLRGADIRDDLAQRDFTVNAMAVAVEGGGLVDPFEGLAHLRAARLVAVSEHIFTDDPLRLMRAARFSHVLGLQLDTSLAEAVKSQALLLAHVAPERVAAEMVLTLSAGRAARAVRLWESLGLLQVVIPEVLVGRRRADALGLVEQVDRMLMRPVAWFPMGADRLAARLTSPVDGTVSRPVALRLAALLHALPALEAGSVVRRLKLSGRMLSLVHKVCGRFQTGPNSEESDQRAGFHLEQIAKGTIWSRADILFLWDAAPWEPEVIMVEAAAACRDAGIDTSTGSDSAATAGTGVGSGTGTNWHRLLGPARRLMALWAERATRGVSHPVLDGDALMQELGLRPGPTLGEVVREVRLTWEAGEAVTYDELLAVARATLAPKQGAAVSEG